jgi:hypothetical protein
VQRALVIVLAAAALAAPAAQAADTPSSLSVKATNAIFKGQFGTAWSLLHPRHRAVVSKARFTQCHAKELASFGKLHILRVDAATTQAGTATFPPLGKISVAVVTVQITYTATGVTGQQVGTNTAYWTRASGRWVGLLSPVSYRAFKAGKCP